MSGPIRVGTRRSALARTQSASVVRRLRLANPRTEFEFVLIDTQGDRDRTPGGSPDFTRAIERRLRAGSIDLAVHSTKDLPARDPSDLVIAAYPRRADPRDCVVARRWPLPRRARIGSSSVRRRAQLARWRPDLRVIEIRGNVDTRIGRVGPGGLDAVVLARAGLERLGRRDAWSGLLPLDQFLPSPGQGALAVQVRRDSRRLRAAVARIDHPTTRVAVGAERALAAELGATCNVPLGVLGQCRGDRLHLRAEVLSEDGRLALSARVSGSRQVPLAVARELAGRLRAAGAGAILDRYR